MDETAKTTKIKTAKAKSSASAVDTGAAASTFSPVTLPPSRTLIVDNGGDTIKYGWMDDATKNRDGLPSTTTAPFRIANVSARLMHQVTILSGDELDKIQNPNNLYGRQRSTERGVITNLETQTRVWKRMLDLLNVTGIPLNTEAAEYLGWKVQRSRKKKSGMAAAVESATGATTASAEETVPKIPVQTIAVLLLLPPHCPRVVLEQILHIWMEDFGVAHVGFAVSTACAGYNQTQRTPLKTSCTVDIGYSATLVVPTFKNRIVKENSVRRLPIGGRQMVNILKYYMSYRQYNLMDQDVLMRDVFEKLSYLSLDFREELKSANLKPSGRRLYDRDYVLPDYQKTFRGEIRLPPQLQRDLEREAKRREEERKRIIGGQDGGDDDDEDYDDEEEDEDFVADEDDDDNDDDEDGGEDYSDDNMMVMDDGDNKKSKETKKIKKRRKKKSRGVGAGDDDDGDDDDEMEEDEEEESMEDRRKRMLQQRAEEAHRRRLQEEEEQVLRVSIERFTIPEVLFRPLDAGLQPDMVGICQSIVQSVQACPKAYRPALYRTIYLVGGVSCLPNMKERLEQELRSLIPSEYEMSISLADSPIGSAWHGANSIFGQVPYTKWSISRQEWESSAEKGNMNQNKSYTKLLEGKHAYYV